METSSSLATESFSYSWLSNIEPPSYGIDESLRTSLDSFPESISNFHFEIPKSQISSASVVHADELFSNGLIKPVFACPSKVQAPNASDLYTVLPPGSSLSSRNVITILLGHYHLLGKLRISSKKILRKCFGYLRPHCHKFGSSRKSSKVDDIDNREREVKSSSNSPQASPRPSIKYSAGDWFHIENSIYEAILHCKKTIENDH